MTENITEKFKFCSLLAARP